MASDFKQPHLSQTCTCFSAPHDHLLYEKYFGMDEGYASASLLRCPKCGRIWLELLIEDEAFTASGRWYLGAVSTRQAARLTAQNARATLEGLSWYFYGGSYYGGRTGRTSGPIW